MADEPQLKAIFPPGYHSGPSSALPDRPGLAEERA